MGERTMNNRISHSSINIYNECGQKYFLHYNQKLRSVTTGSALLFGSAIDKALENALKTFPNCDINDTKAQFMKHWSDAELNGQPLVIPGSSLVKYTKGDYELDEDPWISLSKKGMLMIEAFYRDVLPNIEKVISAQEEISLINDNGDAVVGFADCVLQWKGEKSPVIMDFKTSAKKYLSNAVLESQQLALYKHSLSAKYSTIRAGFIVFIKSINKNASKICKVCKHDGSATSHKTCNNELPKQFSEGVRHARCGGELTITYNPKVDVQVLIDDIDETFENSILDSFDEINTKIQEKQFEPNWAGCMTKYGPCLYKEYCMTGNMVGLVKVESRAK
jgi:hypothetical protein